MKIAEGLYMLQINGSMMGNVGVFNPVYVTDGKDGVLVDTGVPGQSGLIEKALISEGISMDRINKIIITHQDMDHIGGLSAIKSRNPEKIEVISHSEEKPYIQGDKRSVKFTPEFAEKINKALSSMPEDKRAAFEAVIKNIPCKVDTTIEDGTVLPYCGGISVIHTPGHTPGHICLYLQKYKVLVAGDALNVVDGVLVGPNQAYTYDMKSAEASLEKLLNYDIDTVLCYHGGSYSTDTMERLKELALDKR